VFKLLGRCLSAIWAVRIRRRKRIRWQRLPAHWRLGVDRYRVDVRIQRDRWEQRPRVLWKIARRREGGIPWRKAMEWIHGRLTRGDVLGRRLYHEACSTCAITIRPQ
jgi:hypothetical protein